jgi:Flp pilus assembly protein TadB
MPKSIRDILDKYSSKIEAQINSSPNSTPTGFSKEYSNFKQDMIPEVSRYQRWSQTLGNIVKIKVGEKDREKVQRNLDIAHLDVTPSQALTLAIFSFLFVFILSALASMAIYFINGTFPTLFIFLGLIASIFVFYYTYTMPKRLANIWRLKASSQMVPAILYIVVYMKHTSNLERAIAFAAEHLQAPLSLDFRKVFYDVEVGKFSSIKQSLDNYLETWQGYAPEFIESFHLIESSLFEPTEGRRVQILEKSLQVILDGVYEKLLKFSREIRSPLTNLYMLGIILPTLGLALLPLASTLLGGLFQWYHVFVIFNIIIPFFVFYMTSEVLFKRPGGHGEASVLEKNPDYHLYTSKRPWLIAFLITFPLLIISLIPFLFQVGFVTDILNLQSDYTFQQLGLPFLEDSKIFDFKILPDGTKTGPFGPLAVLLSLFLPISIGLFFAIAYKMKTKVLIKSRVKTKELEKEFTNSIFQLGNRLGDGTPAEIAFAKVASSTQGQKTQNFFALVNQNIQQLGMSLKEAIFNPKRGAIIYYPSALISTSMRILLESARKGIQVATRSLMSISEYVKNIQKINERLRDLLAEVVSDMRSNMTFLAPLLAGIVVGLASMITAILNRLSILTEIGGGGQELGGFGSIANITSIFNVTEMIPPYFIQVSIGLYIVEIIFILTTALVTVDSGKDKLQEKYQLSINLKRGIILYTITALISILALTFLASIALGGLAL